MTVAKVVVYKDAAGEWRWTAKAANGQIVADSSEGYRHRIDASSAANALFPEAWVEHLPETANEPGR